MKIIKPKGIKNKRYYFIGVIYIVLNYIYRNIFGYSNPRNFPVKQIERTIDYDFKVVENLKNHLSNYIKEADPLRDKVVLELGPGPDLGVGLILLVLGVKKYIALDAYELAKYTPSKYYEKLFDRLKEKYLNCNLDYLKEQLDKSYKGEGRISYVVDRDFRVKKIKDKIDVVFSNAAFEHFEDVGKTIREIGDIAKKGCILVSRIDLTTHTRLIRNRDPLNIYRYSDLFWNAFKFKGSHNRIRTTQYKPLLEANNWFDIEIKPVRVLEKEYVEKVKPSLNKKYKDFDDSEMQILGFALMDKKK